MQKQELAVTPLAAPPAGAPPGVVCYTARFASPLAKDAVESVAVSAAFLSTMTPNPAKVAQKDPHLLEFSDNAYIITPYTVSAQTTEVGRGLTACLPPVVPCDRVHAASGAAGPCQPPE